MTPPPPPPLLLLLLLVLNAWLKSSESLDDYEVVRPVRLHGLRKRHAEAVRAETMRYAMTVGGRDIEMLLEKNNELLAKGYTETHYQDDGTEVTAAPRDIDHCYYHGRIVNDSRSAVSISTCDGLRGFFRTSAQHYLIQPLSGGDEGQHAVSALKEGGVTPAVCGVTNTSWSDDFEPPTSRSRSRSRSRSAGTSILQQQKYIELFLVADHREYVKMNRDLTALRKRMFDMVNFVNMAYKPLRTFIALVGLEVWSSRDLISVTPPAGANLNAFMTWRNDVLMKRKKHDNAHLISAIDFEGATVGLAYIGTLCSGHSVGVVQDHNDQAVAVGATLAHEMGHNLGMDHDDSSACACSADSCIMAAALSWRIPRTFSSCSSSGFHRFLERRSPDCLLDKPELHSLEAPAVCGNGFRERQEQCDCGTLEECTNPCCNATSCTLKEGSQCAEGDCCQDCQIAPRSKECRSKQDECDLAEYCDGKSTGCPEDVFAVNGLPCDGGLGYCYNGQCPQRPGQCTKMYGPSAVEAPPGCYNQNTRGVYYGFCRRPSRDSYIPCQQEDKFCGKLFCQGGNENPNYGRMVRVGNCKAAFFDDHGRDFGQVEPGTKCGDGKVCSQNECVDLETAYRNVNCSSRCPGHAVCNHRSECQCEAGWIPPSCSSKDEAFDHLSTGATVGIVLAVLLLLCGVAAAIVGFIWKRRQSPVLPTSHRKPPAVQRAVPRQPPPPLRQGVKAKPKGAPPPPPPAGNRPKPPGLNYTAARQALRPVPPPKV